jgi:hypothetical protein
MELILYEFIKTVRFLIKKIQIIIIGNYIKILKLQIIFENICKRLI